jgi:PAS domain S-box-containing protein
VGRVSHALLETKFPVPLWQIESEALATGAWEGELIHRRRDGSVVSVASRWAVQRDANGKPTAFLESNRDTTQRKLLERRFESLVESSPDAILIVDAAGKIEIVNAQTEKLFGYQRGELSGRPVEIVLPKGLHASEKAPPRETSQSARLWAFGTEPDLCGRRKNGSEFPAEVTLSSLQMGAGSVISAVIRDISSRRAAEEEISKLNAALQRKVDELGFMNKELESFSYSVSHDLRAPVRHVDGFARILAEEFAAQLPDEAMHYLDRIVRAAGQMGTLIDDLLALAHLGRKEVSLRKASLDDLAKSAVAGLPPEVEQRAIEWKIGQLGEVQCDPGLMKLVFHNLLSNAAKFTRTREAAVVEVGKREAGGGAVYFVRDNGVGFDPKYADKLFGVFQRLHHQDDFEGTGIGLATVRRIIQRHGGEVWAESEPGCGATFSFSISAKSGAPGPGQNAEVQGNGGSRD